MPWIYISNPASHYRKCRRSRSTSGQSWHSGWFSDFPRARCAEKSTPATDHFRWLGGLRFSGWVADESRKVVHLTVAVDGAQILQVSTLGWAQAGDDVNNDRPARAFDFHLPERFADGCVRWVNVSKDSGEALSNGPLPFVAFPDGLAAAISSFGELESERLRGEMYDHLIPMSLPMSQYEAWQQRFPLPAAPASSRHCAVVLVGQGPIEATLDSLENQTHDLWAACALDDHARTAFEASAARTFLSEDAADSEFVVFALAGTVFEPDALRRILEAFSDFDDAVAVYGDINVLAADGGVWPLAFPAFDYERLLEQGYCAHLFALRRDIAESLLAASPSNLYRLFNALFDQGSLTAAQVIHLPGALGTLPSFDRTVASVELREATELHLKSKNDSSNRNLVVAGCTARRQGSTRAGEWSNHHHHSDARPTGSLARLPDIDRTRRRKIRRRHPHCRQ